MKINVFKDLNNIVHLFNLLCKNYAKKNYNNTENIHFITCRKFFPEGGAGGGGAVQSANKVIFGDYLNNIPLKYSFYEDNKYTKNRKNELWDLWGAVEFVKNKTKKEKGYAYITHDYGTAFGLALLGKKFVLVSHIQGSRVEEKINFGEKFTDISKMIIQFCEKYAFQKAKAVYFPSQGAYEYFCQSKYKIINKNEFNFGGVLYNTLYAYPKSEPIQNIEKQNDSLTILSVGQLTTSKGMDRHPAFLQSLLNHTNKKIRYIMVGNGVLHNKILEALNDLKKCYSNFEYIYIEKCTYSQMQYLQDIADIYLMLHRISIFDLTTLEVMNKEKCVILSNVGGNPEFNKEDNIILVEKDNYDNAVLHLLNNDIVSLGRKNKQVYNQSFSNEEFKKEYFKVIKELMHK